MLFWLGKPFEPILLKKMATHAVRRWILKKKKFWTLTPPPPPTGNKEMTAKSEPEIELESELETEQETEDQIEEVQVMKHTQPKGREVKSKIIWQFQDCKKN